MAMARAPRRSRSSTMPDGRFGRPGVEAAAKLDRAAMIAKVKAKLVSDLGLSTMAGIDVDVRDGIVTLRGTVPSEDYRRRAEQAAMQVDGVGRVADELRVSP